VLDSPSCTSNVILSAPATRIEGDVGVCGGVTGTVEKLTIDGDLVEDTTPPGTNLSIHSDVVFTNGHGIQQENLSDACGDPSVNSPGDCRNASTAALGLSTTPGCTQSIGNLTTSTTFTGNGGLNVICINNINLVKQTLTFTGNANDRFIINVTGPGVSGVQILNNVTTVLNLPGPHPAAQILWNFTAAGTTVSFFKGPATFAGSVLVPNGSFLMDQGRLDGSVCAGCTAKFHSGAFVTCPDVD